MATRQLHGEVEFTYDWYQEYLDHLLAEGCDFRTFHQQPVDGSVHLRHDVDLSLTDALRMARIEAERGIQSTYCILLSSPLYNPLDGKNAVTVREIEALGHDIGLHFSTHNYWRPDESPRRETIEQRVRDERRALEIVTEGLSETVSFHRPVSWILGREFEAFQNTYAQAYFTDIEYIADSNQRWRGDPPTVSEISSPVQLLTHPGLWGDADGTFEDRIERSVTNSCRTVKHRANEEFIEPQQPNEQDEDDR